jgi:hypothetical protein
MTVLIIVMIVPIVVFGITFFITSSVTRHDAQARKMTALYLAQAGIHRAIFNIEAAISPVLNVTLDGNTIAVTVVAQCSNIYQLKSIGTSVAPGSSVSRTVFAQYDSSTNNVSIYLESDGTGIQPPVCCADIWWPFSEGSGSTTGTAPYVGTLVNSPPWVAGRIGTALSFNTTTAHRYVTVPDSSGLDLTTAGTVMAWIYNTAQINTNTGIVHKGNLSNSTDEAYGLTLTRNGSNRRIKFELRDTGGTSRNVTANTNLALNTWYHVAGTWGPSGLKAYINGAQAASSSIVRVARATAGNLQIGTRVTNRATTRFIGTIDEVHVYACEKTAAEILDYYNATKP